MFHLLLLMCFFLGFIGEVFEGQSNADNRENKQRNNHHPKTHTVEHDQDHTHAGEHHTRQISYTSDQLYKIGKSFYITKFYYTTANTIKILGIRQTFRTKRTDRRRKGGKRGGTKYVRPWDTNQGIHRSLRIPVERHHKTLWNSSMCELMLTHMQLLKPKINMILHYFLQHKLDICFITETWISKNDDLQYIKANLMTQGFNILSCERKNRKGGHLECIYNERFKMK